MYNLEDALVVGQWLNVFLRKSHVLKIACVAQVVNIISWLHTRGDDLLKHPSFDVFALVSNHARGQALDTLVKAPHVETKKYGDVPLLDVSASYDATSGDSAIFIVNRSQTDSVTTELVWQDGRTYTMGEAWQLAGDDPKAGNTWEAPNAITAQKIAAPQLRDGKAALQLPPLSFTTLTLRSA
jgi:alpha-N-arabinofuranosidase